MGAPDGYRATDEIVMRNLDRSIDSALARRLQRETVTMQYAAWQFHGVLWCQDGQFHCLLSVHGREVETVTRPTLEDILEYANLAFGPE